MHNAFISICCVGVFFDISDAKILCKYSGHATGKHCLFRKIKSKMYRPNGELLLCAGRKAPCRGIRSGFSQSSSRASARRTSVLFLFSQSTMKARTADVRGLVRSVRVFSDAEDRATPRGTGQSWTSPAPKSGVSYNRVCTFAQDSGPTVHRGPAGGFYLPTELVQV